MRKKHGSVPKLHTCSGLDSHNEQKHWHSKCHYKRNSGSTSAGTKTDERRAVARSSSGDDNGGACGATEDRRTARRRPLQQRRRRRLLLRGANSGSADLRADAAAKRPLPMPKLVRQGRAEGRRVGGQSVGGPGYLVGGRTSSSCRGRRRRRERLRSHSRPRARHAAAAGAMDDDRLSL
jgi:hypothetical protein